jgi:hypothetical protein
VRAIEHGAYCEHDPEVRLGAAGALSDDRHEVGDVVGDDRATVLCARRKNS